MDHLTWLWEIQQVTADGALPELPTAVSTAARKTKAQAHNANAQMSAARKAAVAELTALLEKTSAAEQTARLTASQAAQQSQTASSAKAEPTDFYGSTAAYGLGGGFEVGTGPTMEEISRFFEIDARRF